MLLTRAPLLVLVVAGALAACGGGGDSDRAAARCDPAPGAGATLATADVAFAAREGEELESSRADGGGYLPWSTKFALHVRGRGNVVVRVPAAQQDEVNIVGWGAGADDPPQTDVSVSSAAHCWRSYPGGLIFTGRPCVRLQVEGPGALRGTARFGLRRDCGPETLTDRELFVVADAELVFATIALAAIDHEACLEKASKRRCGATGEREADRLLAVFRAKPDGVYTLPEDRDVTLRDIVADWADQLREARPEIAARLAAAL